MKIDVHVHLDGTEQQRRVEDKLDRLLSAVQTLITKENRMSQQMDALVEQVAKTDGVIESAVVAFNGFGRQLTDLQNELAAAGVDTAKLDALRTDLAARTDALAAAIPATPVAP